MISIIEGDITKLKVDAIVNAANEMLQHGGGVAKAIADAAGKDFVKESRKSVEDNGLLKIGEARKTSGGDLNCRFVIHVVGPRGTIESKLTEAIENVFLLARRLKVKSIAVPAVSCGIFGFDKKIGAKIIYSTSKEYEKEMDIVLIDKDKEIVSYWKGCSKQ